MSEDKRLKSLLKSGFFPEELPPPFNTSDFARFRKTVAVSWGAINSDYPKTVPEIYSVPRIRGVRRDLSIVNPIAEFHLCQIIAKEWKNIKSHINQHSLSVDSLEIRYNTERAVPPPDFARIALRRSEISALYDHALLADISRFYGTLYTHAIPWALHTKPWAKANLNKKAVYDPALGPRLDRAVRKGNDNQTIGIPVGPDSSRILSEIVASSIDRYLWSKIEISQRNAFRNVDDWYIGFDDVGSAESALAIIAAGCRDYQLEIHPEKTRTKGPLSLAESIWPTELRQIVFGKNVRDQRRSIDHFFAKALQFSVDFHGQNVLDFAVKRTKGISIFKENWPIYETYLLQIVRVNSTALPAVVQILTSYNYEEFPIEKGRIKKLIIDNISKFAPMANHSEVAWSLFLAKALRINLSNKEIEQVFELESSVCALLILDLKSRGLINGLIDTSLWMQSLTKEGLESNLWLLAYESDLKGWLAGSVAGYVEGHAYFSVLKNKKISFYGTKKNVKHISPPKPAAIPSHVLSLMAPYAGEHSIVKI